MALVETRLGKRQDAIQSFIELTPNEAKGLGIALADRLDLEGVLAEFSEAVRLKPNDPNVVKLLEMIAGFKSGKVQKVTAAIR